MLTLIFLCTASCSSLLLTHSRAESPKPSPWGLLTQFKHPVLELAQRAGVNRGPESAVKPPRSPAQGRTRGPAVEAGKGKYLGTKQADPHSP